MTMTEKLDNRLYSHRNSIYEGLNEILDYGEDEELPQKEVEELISALQTVEQKIDNVLYCD